MADEPDTPPTADDLDHPDLEHDSLDPAQLVADHELDGVVLSPSGDQAKLDEYARLFGTSQP